MASTSRIVVSTIVFRVIEEISGPEIHLLCAHFFRTNKVMITTIIAVKDRREEERVISRGL